MKQTLKLKVVLTQKSKFPKTLPLEVILNDEFQYGIMKGNRFFASQYEKDGFIAYHPDHIGRGIRVVWNPKEEESIKLVLLLPSTYEEIHDFITMIARITKAWTCAVTLNGYPLTTQELIDKEEEIERMNSKVLQDFVVNLIENENQFMEMQCALHQLSISKQEVTHWLNQSSTDLFRNWLHERQQEMVYTVEPEILEKEDEKIGLFTIPMGVPVLLPKKPMVEKQKIAQWMVQFYDAEENTVLAYYAFDELLKLLKENKKRDYDALYWIIGPMQESDLEALRLGRF